MAASRIFNAKSPLKKAAKKAKSICPNSPAVRWKKPSISKKSAPKIANIEAKKESLKAVIRPSSRTHCLMLRST